MVKNNTKNSELSCNEQKYMILRLCKACFIIIISAVIYTSWLLDIVVCNIKHFIRMMEVVALPRADCGFLFLFLGVNVKAPLILAFVSNQENII